MYLSVSNSRVQIYGSVSVCSVRRVLGCGGEDASPQDTLADTEGESPVVRTGTREHVICV